ncbi:MAG: nicotinate (nicotinamide) nucleotide adenylyltransferase [Planctomycetota bacterium]|nr:MAG: nicotinate (nicotinamide) nucleotide adenylyltransferase [Planctomycetota bacterium]
MRLGIFGGSFDPVHYGHLLLAETCREQLSLDRVLFVPAGRPPHKPAESLSPAQDRAAMLELAIGGNPHFEICRFELDRDEVSYTVDTLRRLREEYPDAGLFLLLGTDMFHDLPNWRCAAEIVQLATPVPVRRCGMPPLEVDKLTSILDSARLEIVRNLVVTAPQVDFSGTDLRERVRTGRSIRYRTPRAVEEYIYAHGLYGSARPTTP